MNFTLARHNMVEQQIRPWDVLNFELLDVLQDIPREHFVLDEHRPLAYTDSTLPLANGGTMLEPRVVARLIQSLQLHRGAKVLEIGTGSGYATAVLAKLGGQVLSVDIDAEQQRQAQANLAHLNLANITYKTADGLAGVADQAPYDAIYVGGGCAVVPEALTQQLANNGRMVVIVGTERIMQAQLIVRNGDQFTQHTLFETQAPLLQGQAIAHKPETFEF